ncbi:MAG: hypothetical protein E6R09_07770 [Rhodocyclaceae bacterium]|nr:MAG: hypothetical protein E6R09_07770 [Rhodocyclaceae bacterium]
MSDILTTRTHTIAGWCRTHDGAVIAFLVNPDCPGDGIHMECPNWWNGLALAMELARMTPDCLYVGGPEQ